MNEEKIKEVLSNEEFVNSLMELETPEEVQKALEEKDIDLSVDEIKKLAELLQKKASGELTDEDLEDVAGGAEAVCAAIVAVWVAYELGPRIVRGIRRCRW